MNVMIDVTEADIRRGKRGHGTKCPIARAVKRAVPDAPWVDEYKIRTAHDHAMQTPRSAARFIRAFDTGKPVKPFRFRLEVPV